MTLEAWALAAMMAYVPYRPVPTFAEAAETETARAERFQSIASDLAGLSASKNEKALLLALAILESGLAKDVDLGPCSATRVWQGGCDHGQSACILQLRVGEGKTAEGFTKADLFADRKKCLNAGLRRIRESLRTCARVGVAPEERLALYTSGSCDRGRASSRTRMALARRLLARMQDPATAGSAPTAPAKK